MNNNDKTEKNLFFHQVGNQQIFNDLINNQFDLAWHYGVEKNKTYSIVSAEKDTKDDGSVVYNYNSELFRSDEFIKNHNGQHILFSGCSESEGVGGNIEDAWTKILYNKISKEIKCSGFFNLSRAGWGWNRIILNCLIYFEKYGYPNFLFILLPNNQRKFDYSENGHLNDQGFSMGNWKYVQKYPNYYFKKDGLDLADQNIITSKPKEYNEDFINFLISWKLFNKICEDNKIKLFFSTWDKLEDENIKEIKIFNNFVTVFDNDKNKYLKQFYNENKKTKIDIIKRDGHEGKFGHFVWSEKFYNKYAEGKNKNEKNI
jgi:hypothetical protein